MNEELMDDQDIGSETSTVKEKARVPALSDAEFADQLELSARKIELLRITAILQITREAAKIHETLRYCRREGGYTGYMKRRLGYSSSYAYRLLAIHAVIGDGECFPNWERLPVSAVYQLCESSTPKEARDNITERLAAGEELSCAAVTAAIAQAKNGGADSDTAAEPEPTEDPGTAAHRKETSQ
jgi:hypothetical protein